MIGLPPQLLARRGVELLAALWAVVLLVVVLWRVGFPLELEWMEGGMLHEALRIQRGQSPYPPPGPEFVPFLYTPLYSVVLAGLGFVLPLGFVLGRVVSILAWIATMLAVWAAVKGEGKPRAHAALAVGLCCAGYVFTFRWIDLARPDTLFIALVVWGLVLLRRSRERWSTAVWAGVLVGLAFWTKQTAASFVIASGLGALLVAPRRLPVYAGTIAVIDGGGVLLGNALTDGWLWEYIYALHQSHAFNEERFTTKTWGMFVHAWPLVMLVALGLVSAGLGRLPARLRAWRAEPSSTSSDDAAIGQSDREAEAGREAKGDGEAEIDGEPEGGSEAQAGGEARRAEAEPAPTPLARWRGPSYWTLMAAAGLLVSALGYSTQWAEPNAFIPGVVLGALALAVALPSHGRGEALALGLGAAQLLLCLVAEPLYHPVQQKGLAGLGDSYRWQDPWRTLPTAEQWQRAAALRAELEATEGEVLALHRPWWSVIAGGQGHVGSMGVTDVRDDDRAAIQQAIRDAITQQRYAAIWLEGEPPRWLSSALRRNYRVGDRRTGDRRVRPLSGYMSEAGMVTPYRRDQLLFVPPGPSVVPLDAIVLADFESGTSDGFSPEGPAFARPQRGPPRSLPPAGPYGGDWLLGSGGPSGRVALMGSATSEPLTLPASGHLEMRVGYAGTSPRGLSLWIQEDGGSGRTARISIPTAPHALVSRRWAIEPSWAGARIRVRLGDESPEALLYFDDLWLVAD